jgi:histidinol dehydrogenase
MQLFLIKDKISANLSGLEKTDFYQFITKSQKLDENVTEVVNEIIAEVQKNGDQSLIKFCNKFDNTSFKKSDDLLVKKSEIDLAVKSLDKKIKSALELSFARIKAYHQKQLPKDFTFKDKIGVTLGNHWKAIESIGVYVPGGSASYPSSVLMSAVPALVCGVKEITICAPTTGGKINPAVLFAAQLCGIEKIYKVGGAQAIAALTFGTNSIKKVNKIVGPGNSFVACAKKILFGEVGIDMIAGPTDVTIIADKNINPSWVAADALSQLEHGHDSKAFVITDDEKIAKKIIAEILRLKEKLPRQKIINESLKNSAIFVIKNLDDAVHIANFIAPEHLQIATKNPKKLLPKIHNAGAIFLGNYTPESIGDYTAGPSHTLPTSASAKFSSGLSVFDFLKRISVISCDKKSFAKLAKATSDLAHCEGLLAHKLSIDIRHD